MTDIGTHVNANNEYAVEFGIDEVFLLGFNRFWRFDQLFRVFLKRTFRLQGPTSAEVCLLSYFMGAFSPKPNLISCTGCSARTVQLLDQSPYGNFSIQSPPRFQELNLPQVLHKKNNSVFGRIDFFVVVKYLVVSLGGCIELDWVLLSPELSKLFCTDFSYSIHCMLSYMWKSSTQFCIICGSFKQFYTKGLIVAQ